MISPPPPHSISDLYSFAVLGISERLINSKIGWPRFMGVGFGGINHENVSPVVNPEFPEFFGGDCPGGFY